jgi:hypothetical protein
MNATAATVPLALRLDAAINLMDGDPGADFATPIRRDCAANPALFWSIVDRCVRAIAGLGHVPRPKKTPYHSPMALEWALKHLYRDGVRETHVAVALAELGYEVYFFDRRIRRYQRKISADRVAYLRRHSEPTRVFLTSAPTRRIALLLRRTPAARQRQAEDDRAAYGADYKEP